jgi:hypothetical protein
MGGQVEIRLSPRTLDLRRPQARLHGSGYSRCHAVLEEKNVVARSVVAMGPDMASGGRFD